MKSESKSVSKKTKPNKTTSGVLKRKNRRNIIRGIKTAWIYFCNKNRARVQRETPGASFGDVCKILAPEWKLMSREERCEYMALHTSDKKRFRLELDALSSEQKQILKELKKSKRETKKKLPKPRLSPYMYFVMEYRPVLVKKHPDAGFQSIGRLLGKEWNKSTEEEKEKYVRMSMLDKERYDRQLQTYTTGPRESE